VFPRRSRVVWLAPCAAVAAIAVASTRDATPPAAEVPARPLAASTAPAPGPVREPAEVEETAPLVPLDGDAALSGLLDPTSIARVDDHYEAALPDGRRARLTLAPRWQEAAAAILRESRAPRGAVVVLDVDGSVLALAGRRATDPKGSVDGTPDVKLALDVWAPAASIFKLVTATALVEAGVRPAQRVCFHGGVRSVMESNLTDSKQDRRCEDFTYGVSHSQNAIIAKLVHQHLEPSDLDRVAKALGVAGDIAPWALGGTAGTVEIPTEKGVELGKTAAGFKGTQLSAIGGALLASAIGNKGVLAPPRIVAELIDGDRRAPVSALPGRRAIEARVAEKVGAMMVSTCYDGSAAKSFRSWKGATVAGKTGTLAHAKPFYQEYTWFVGYAKTDKGAIAIAVVLGNAEDWWMKAHTAARKVFERAFKPSV
jgi:cell division protein FtsI/penicillin-binding protein 2